MIAVGKRFLFILLLLGGMIVPIYSMGQEINGEGWPIPDLKGILPYSITIKRIEGVEKVVEKFHTPNGGHVARISGNGKVFAYAVDSDQDPPIDYLLLDPDGYGKFTHKWMAEESYSIPDWISN